MKTRAISILVTLAFVLGSHAARAQSTAVPVVTGYLASSGCSYGQTTCFVQFGAGGGGGGGGGAITAATGSYSPGALSLGAIVDLGTGATPGANTTNGILKQINTTLGSPFQSGGSIGNTAFGISGTLPAFATTPAFTLSGTGAVNLTQVNGTAISSANPVPVSATVSGSQSNAGAGTTGATNIPNNSYNYVWGGTAWTQLLGDNFSATTSHLEVVGSSAAGATDDGANPLKVGCLFMTTRPTYTNGQRGNLQCSTRGEVDIAGLAFTGQDSVSNSQLTAISGSGLAGLLLTAGAIYNNTSGDWDRQRSVIGLDGTGLGVTAVSNILASNASGSVQTEQSSIGGITSSGCLSCAAVAEAPHAVSLFTPVVVGGVGTLLGKAGSGNLYTAYLTNTDTVVHWLWVVNQVSAPANGSFTAGAGSGNVEDCVEVAAGQTGSIGGLSIPSPYSVGIYFANSTTGCGASSNTLTLSTVGFIHGLVK